MDKTLTEVTINSPFTPDVTMYIIMGLAVLLFVVLIVAYFVGALSGRNDADRHYLTMSNRGYRRLKRTVR